MTRNGAIPLTGLYTPMVAQELARRGHIQCKIGLGANARACRRVLDKTLAQSEHRQGRQAIATVYATVRYAIVYCDMFCNVMHV